MYAYLIPTYIHMKLKCRVVYAMHTYHNEQTVIWPEDGIYHQRVYFAAAFCLCAYLFCLLPPALGNFLSCSYSRVLTKKSFTFTNDPRWSAIVQCRKGLYFTFPAYTYDYVYFLYSYDYASLFTHFLHVSPS